MDDLFGKIGFTIPAEVSVRLLPQQNISAGEHRSSAATDDGVEGPVRRQLYEPSGRTHWAAPLISDARSRSIDSECNFDDPSSRRLRQQDGDGRRDSGALHAAYSHHTFTKRSERERREAGEDYSNCSEAATVVRDQMFPQTRITYAARHRTAPRRQRLVTDQADYEVIKPLRPRAQYGKQEELYLLEDCDTKELFVQKRLSMTSPSSRERATAERNALWQIMMHEGASAHIVQVVEAFYESGDPYSHLILEYCDSDTLENFIHRYKTERKTTPEDFAWHVLASLASALCTCHYGVGHAGAIEATRRDWKMLCHLNIKPSNVWLTSQRKVGPYPRVVLAGFDLVSTKENVATKKAHDLVAWYGDQAWMPPEGRHNEDRSTSGLKLGSATDIWRTGAIIHVLCRVEEGPPVEGVDVDHFVCGRGFSFGLNNIVACCMQSDWRNRPDAKDLAKEVRREMLRRAQSQERRVEGGGYSMA